jgi:hypothetical protein
LLATIVWTLGILWLRRGRHTIGIYPSAGSRGVNDDQSHEAGATGDHKLEVIGVIRS